MGFSSPDRAAPAKQTSTCSAVLAGCAAFISDGGGDNPYFGMMAYADAFVVTCNSVNMITEACSTGKPVHVVQLPAQGRRVSERDKFARFQRGLGTADASVFSKGGSRPGLTTRCARWSAWRALSKRRTCRGRASDLCARTRAFWRFCMQSAYGDIGLLGCS